VRLIDDLLAYDIQTIAFGRSRRTVELVLSYLRRQGEFVRLYQCATEQIRAAIAAVICQLNGAKIGAWPSAQGVVRAVVATTTQWSWE